MSTRRFAAWLLLISVVIAGCRRQDNTIPEVEFQDRIIAAVASTDDPAKLIVRWFPAPCESFDQVLVELDADYANLTVRVSVDVEDCPESSITETVVDLGEPLGERQIWDRAFGNTVALDAG